MDGGNREKFVRALSPSLAFAHAPAPLLCRRLFDIELQRRLTILFVFNFSSKYLRPEFLKNKRLAQKRAELCIVRVSAVTNRCAPVSNPSPHHYHIKKKHIYTHPSLMTADYFMRGALKTEEKKQQRQITKRKLCHSRR